MLNKTGFKVTEGYNDANTILFCEEGKLAIGVVVGNAGLSADGEGKKILKAGTPIEGDLTARTTAMKKVATKANTVGILMYDVDVTSGEKSAQIFIAGVFDLNKIDSATAALIDAEVKTALPACHFVK